eukprot:766797-Hanusia_phi.AAC.1
MAGRARAKATNWSIMRRDGSKEEATDDKHMADPGRNKTTLSRLRADRGEKAGSHVEQALIAKSIEREGELKMRVQTLEGELREKDRLVQSMREKMNSMLHVANDCGAQWTGVWLALNHQEDPKDLSMLLDQQAKNAEALQIAAEITGAEREARNHSEDADGDKEAARKMMFTDSEIRDLCGVPLSGEMYSYVRWSKPGELQVGELVAVRRQNSVKMCYTLNLLLTGSVPAGGLRNRNRAFTQMLSFSQMFRFLQSWKGLRTRWTLLFSVQAHMVHSMRDVPLQACSDFV